MAQFLWKSKTAAQTQNLRIFGNFQKGNLPRNLPWSFPRTVLVLEPKSFLLMSFWWNNLNNKNIFFYFCRGPWKLRKWPKNLKTCCFGMFPKEFWKVYYRYSESWLKVFEEFAINFHMQHYIQEVSFHWKLTYFRNCWTNAIFMAFPKFQSSSNSVHCCIWYSKY